MGEIQVFTKEQKIILDVIKQNDFLRSNFYFTGGTALSAFYLFHRYSEDLDFFSEEEFDNQVLLTLMEEWGKKHNFSIQSRFIEVVYIFNLVFKKRKHVRGQTSDTPALNVDEIASAFSLAMTSLCQ